ncbi:MAG TPA: c-type cytochrome [Solirubrobacterales bacterium]|jgi:cytochrome c551/c552|nr:c-type cytochrome [Solirubrobacterales bacterium]
MREPSWKEMLIEGWAFIVIGAICFVGGLVAGGLLGSTKTETVTVAASSNPLESEAGEAEEAEEAEEGSGAAATGGSASNEPGAQVFAGNGCGSCHTFKAANSTGTTGPNLNEYLAPDDDQAGIEEMIVDPNSEIAEGYSANVMPTAYGQSISKGEIEQLAQFLVNNSPAGGGQPEGPGGEEHDVGGPTN